MAWWGAVTFCGALLALALATGITLNGMSPYLIRRRADPVPYWLGIFWNALAFVIVLILAVLNEA